jgi:hypothetical protein
MAGRGDTQAAASAHPLLDLFMLARLPLSARFAAILVAVALAAAWGVIALRLHFRYAELQAGGTVLEPLPRLFADGASALTAWPGWAAALLFAISAWRLKRAGPEPPAGRGDPAAMSIAALRAGLRREYGVSRIALVAVSILALIDLGRLAATAIAATGNATARIGLGWMVVEAGGLVAAASVLTLWAREFQIQLDQIGAL